MADPVSILEYHRYLIAGHGTEAYQSAISEIVQPGQTVVDLGSGTGILAFLACKVGARRVYAIELDRVNKLAPEICRSNGLDDRVVLIEAHSTHVSLPEPADVIVTNTLGSFGLDGEMLGALVDARDRFLKPGGRLIPCAMRLYVAPVELPVLYKQRVDYWLERPRGVDYSALRRYAVNNYHLSRFGPEALLGEPSEFASIDFTRATSSQVRGEVTLVATRRGVLHGLGGWFSCTLTENIELTNSPFAPSPHYARAFLPLGQPIALEPGDRLNVMVQTHDGAAWTWRVEHQPHQTESAPAARKPARFDHSTFWGWPLSPQAMKARLTQNAPQLSAKGRAALALLGLIDGARSLAELELELMRACPDAFQTKAEAAAFVREVVERHAEA